MASAAVGWIIYIPKIFLLFCKIADTRIADGGVRGGVPARCAHGVIMKKAVGVLSGAVVAFLLSAGPSLAGGAALQTTLTTSKATIYQNETVDLNATLTGINNSSDCSPTTVLEYKKSSGGVLCSVNLTGTQESTYKWSYVAGVCQVRGDQLAVGLNTLMADVNSSYCYSPGGQAASQVQVTVLAGNAPVAVPTTSEWTLWGLTGLLLIGGGVFASRRFRATAA